MAIEKKTKRNIAIVAVIVAVIIAILLAAVNCQGAQSPQANGTATPTVSSDKAASSEGGTSSDATSHGEGEAQASDGADPASSGGSPSGGESGGSAAVPAAPQHEHSWATRTVDDGDVWVVDQAAWDEQVAVGEHIHCTCGMDWYDNQEAWSHMKQAGCRYSVVTDYEWVHHDEVGHYEHVSHTETYCTGCGAVQ